MPSLVPLIIAAGAIALVVVGVAVRRGFVVAQPDEWLLCIRNGRLVRAGIGIHLFRFPGDVVVRFTSTVQRVSFKVGALSSQQLRVTVDGFILWSLSAEEDAPFRAFQKLGLVNLDNPPEDLRSPKHLLTTSQHHAFQQLLGAAVQRLAATRSLEDLLLRQDAIVRDLQTLLANLEDEMGIHIDEVQILQIRPADEDLLREMSAQVEQSVRGEAETVRLGAAERAKRRAIESEARIAQERADARRQELEREKALRLAQIAHDREVMSRQQEVERQEALAAEARAMEVAKAVLAREEVQLAARLDRTRREADASKDAISAIASAEERKSPGVRNYELARLATEKVGDALKELPLQEARWITMGSDTPAGSLAALIAAVRELALKPPKAA
jgi:hypothetical protein